MGSLAKMTLNLNSWTFLKIFISQQQVKKIGSLAHYTHTKRKEVVEDYMMKMLLIWILLLLSFSGGTITLRTRTRQEVWVRTRLLVDSDGIAPCAREEVQKDA